ncbi:MAG: DUF3467 domain-containing protein [Planctomycetota bacterium]|nr:DUF3467 domain-containing protein [Planctomycetota bacterium]
MAEKKNEAQSSSASSGQQMQLQVHVPPDLEYHYRDMFNIAVGLEEVILEFGNRHRTPPDRATISNRIVLSVPNAFRLQQALQQALANAQKQVQEIQARRQEQGKKN